MDDITVRKAQVDDAAAVASVYVDSWRVTYKGIVADDFLDSLSYEKRTEMWRNALTMVPAPDASAVYLAETAAGELIGFVSVGLEQDKSSEYEGEIFALYIRERWQRQGVGRLLFATAVRELRQRGLDSLIVWVLAANPACAFYEAMGGRRIRHRAIEIGKQSFVEIAYVWPDIIGLV
jgi:ribosomal protein S18 acetylase RimI-like enzyme